MLTMIGTTSPSDKVAISSFVSAFTRTNCVMETVASGVGEPGKVDGGVGRGVAPEVLPAVGGGVGCWDGGGDGWGVGPLDSCGVGLLDG